MKKSLWGKKWGCKWKLFDFLFTIYRTPVKVVSEKKKDGRGGEGDCEIPHFVRNDGRDPQKGRFRITRKSCGVMCLCSCPRRQRLQIRLNNAFAFSTENTSDSIL